LLTDTPILLGSDGVTAGVSAESAEN
jgi:hypothetical protein